MARFRELLVNVRLLMPSLLKLSSMLPMLVCCAVLEPLSAAPVANQPIRKINLLRPPQNAKVAAPKAPSSTRFGQTTPITSPLSKILDPNQNVFPRSSLHDFSNLLDAPAGKHGFLERRGEHFYWSDGSRAKFWGINVANVSLQESDANIDRMIATFRQAGFNLIRLHHFDERDGIIDPNQKDSRHFLAARLKKLDYWIYRAKQNGLYIYLDLLDYRRFKEGDGVVNAEAIGRAARPYNLFDPKLIELQKEYARMLLRDHVNPWTKLAYADDPAVVMLEIYDESGLFMKRQVWREMPPPYANNFKTLWNKWLRQQYGTTARLQTAWGAQSDGPSALESGENLEDRTVEVPAMTPLAGMTASQRVWAKAARRNDGARFAYQLQRDYLRDMKAYLRSIGLRIPVTTVGRFDDIPDLRAVSEECDFVSNNFYFDHPYWGANKPAWTPPSYFHNRNPLAQTGDNSLAWALATSRIKGSPLVVREWNYCWPNQNRASGMIEAASYAALQDIDALILFTYEVAPTPRVFYFNVRSDPARWGLCGIAAQVFLRGLVKPATNRVVIPFNSVDTFSYNEYSNAFYSLAWNTRLENDFYDGTYRADAQTSLILPPGRSGIGQFVGAPALLHTENLSRDLVGRNVGAPQYLSEYSLTAQPSANARLTYGGVLYRRNEVQVSSLGLALPLALLRLQSREAIGVDEQNGVAHGFVDRAQKRLVFGSLSDQEIVPAARQALNLFAAPNIEYSKVALDTAKSTDEWRDPQVALSDSGELRRDARRGQLAVDTPQFQAVCAALGQDSSAQLSALRVQNGRGGVLVALSLDGLPLDKSRRWMIKMVSDAHNRDEQSGRDPRMPSSANGQGRVLVPGRGPVETNGQTTNTAMRISLGSRAVLEIALQGGSFELQADGDKRQFWCDTPGVPYRLLR
jgi:hypothetical protein